MRIAVIGAGTTGLFAALVLARRGHRVALIEKDPRPSPVAADDVFTAWRRPGTPQALLPHGLMGRIRGVLAAAAPDVLAALEAAGAVDCALGAKVPGGVAAPG